jgi:pantoate--beta-alanine ligase
LLAGSEAVKTVHSLRELRAELATARNGGKTVGFVPTMGALHEGHLSLVRRAKKECGIAIVSIFVNPLQFGPGEDFASYPRRPEEDAGLLASAGAELLYAPRSDGFFPPGFSTAVEVSGVTEGGEGAIRPGHFRGVATIVARLFLQVAPDAAYFGRKDLQQVAVVRRMVRDLDFRIRIVACETVRYPDGLAMSSRNAYLSAEERARAAALSRALFAARDRAAAGERETGALERETRLALEAAGLSVDYVQAVEAETMERAARVAPGVALTAAVRLGKTRLIDNVLLEAERTPP